MVRPGVVAVTTVAIMLNLIGLVWFIVVVVVLSVHDHEADVTDQPSEVWFCSPL